MLIVRLKSTLDVWELEDTVNAEEKWQKTKAYKRGRCLKSEFGVEGFVPGAPMPDGETAESSPGK